MPDSGADRDIEERSHPFSSPRARCCVRSFEYALQSNGGFIRYDVVVGRPRRRDHPSVRGHVLGCGSAPGKILAHAGGLQAPPRRGAAEHHKGPSDRAEQGIGVVRLKSEAVGGPARERGCARLYWTTKEDNATARSLYNRIARFNGFIRYDYTLE